MSGFLAKLAMPVATILLTLTLGSLGLPKRVASELHETYQQAVYEVNRATHEVERYLTRDLWP